MRDIVCLSGGKDSTALAIYLDGRIEDLELVWCDTGREPPSLYDFIDELRGYFDQGIKRLHGGWDCNECDQDGTKPDATECPECGGEIQERKMEYWMDRWGDDDSPFLPSAGERWCTQFLKIKPFERYVKQNNEKARVYIGIRADEDRQGNYGNLDQVKYSYPFVEDGIEIEDVRRIIELSGIELPQYYDWRSTGGCWCCPFQRFSDWRGLKQVHPDLFDKAKEEEHRSGFRWNQGYSLDQIDHQQFMFDDIKKMKDADQVWGTLDSGCGTAMCGK